ncbi:MAG: hypothetical protein A2Y40_07580 [Candidatus Margulisbacteria bacterium GWF2_35_9]|nr:MAG: hypothetical protein A2Y40_07580 [Candidatus Margulisbacteria bacterium GWF2_35_9]
MKEPKIAIVHDFLNQQGGAEYVVAIIHEMYPTAPIYTSIYKKGSTWSHFNDADIRTSWMQKIPFIYKFFKLFFFLYPLAFIFFDLKEYDIIISSSTAFAKGIRVRFGQEHICYMHAPPRFLYRTEEYVKKEQINVLFKLFMPYLLTALRVWDQITMKRITHIIANSENIKERIQKTYNRYALIIYPPVDTGRFSMSIKTKNYYLIVSRLVGYKRVDLAVEACKKIGRKLIVIGSGSDINFIKEISTDNIIVMGRQPDDVVEKMMQECRGFIFPGEEDFGISPVEAQACGKPIIAYRAGGALETVIEGKTGVFFNEQSVDSLVQAILSFEEIKWDKYFISRNAGRFSKDRFKAELQSIINNLVAISSDTQYQKYKLFFRDKRLQQEKKTIRELILHYRNTM